MSLVGTTSELGTTTIYLCKYNIFPLYNTEISEFFNKIICCALNYLCSIGIENGTRIPAQYKSLKPQRCMLRCNFREDQNIIFCWLKILTVEEN